MPASLPPGKEILRLAVIEFADISRNGRDSIEIALAPILLHLRPGFLRIVVCFGLPVVRSSVGGDQRRDQNEGSVAARFLEHVERPQKLALCGFDDHHYSPSPIATPSAILIHRIALGIRLDRVRMASFGSDPDEA